MSAKQGLVALAFTAGMGIGVGVAVHEVMEVDTQAARIEACLPQKTADGAYVASSYAGNESCHDTPHSQAEANVLHKAGETYGWLGTAGAVGVILGSIATAAITEEADPARKYYKTITHKYENPPKDNPPSDGTSDRSPVLPGDEGDSTSLSLVEPVGDTSTEQT